MNLNNLVRQVTDVKEDLLKFIKVNFPPYSLMARCLNKYCGVAGTLTKDGYIPEQDNSLHSYEYLSVDTLLDIADAIDSYDAEVYYLNLNGIKGHSVICWPDSQTFIGHNDCELINDEFGLDLFGGSAYIVPNWILNYTLDNAISGALEDAANKKTRGLLYKASDDIPEECADNAETMYSLISLYSDDPNNDGSWDDTIAAKLEEVYPDYF